MHIPLLILFNRKAFLLAWKKKEGFEATYERLLQVSCERNRGDVASVICDVLRAKFNSKEIDSKCFEWLIMVLADCCKICDSIWEKVTC